MMAAVGVQLKNSLSGLGLGKAAARLGDRLEYLIAAFRRTVPGAKVPESQNILKIELPPTRPKALVVDLPPKPGTITINGEAIGSSLVVDIPAGARGAGRVGDAPGAGRFGARNAGDLWDYPKLGLVDPKSRLFTEYAEAMKRHNVRFEFTTEVSFGYTDEVAGVIRLNPETASWSVLNHEVSHMRFMQAMGKWKNGQKLTNFELNLMEAIGYHETYLEGQMFGVVRRDLLLDTQIGSPFAQGANQALRSPSPAVRQSLDRAIEVWGRDFVEDALRFQGRGLHPNKPVRLP